MYSQSSLFCIVKSLTCSMFMHMAGGWPFSPREKGNWVPLSRLSVHLPIRFQPGPCDSQGDFMCWSTWQWKDQWHKFIWCILKKPHAVLTIHFSHWFYCTNKQWIDVSVMKWWKRQSSPFKQLLKPTISYLVIMQVCIMLHLFCIWLFTCWLSGIKKWKGGRVNLRWL